MAHRVLALVLVVTLILGGVSSVAAHDDMTYDELVEKYGSWTRADVEAAGYVVDEFCVNAAAAGAPAELGAMGFHAVNPELVGDGEVHTGTPEAILLDGNDTVIGVEYELGAVVEEPPVALGQPLKVTPPHPGMEQEHMSLHVYFVGDEQHRFEDFNPAVTCPEGSTPPPPETMPETGSTSSSAPLTLTLLGVAGLLLGAGLSLRRREGTERI